VEHDEAVSSLVVGIGCSTGAGALEIVRLVSDCLDGREAVLLGVPEGRAGLSAVVEAGAMLGLPVRAVSDAAIEAVQGRCLTRPCRAAGAVAEGAALVLAGPEAVLIGPRVKGARVTCALAALAG
jgi:hypothetical protein